MGAAGQRTGDLDISPEACEEQAGTGFIEVPGSADRGHCVWSTRRPPEQQFELHDCSGEILS